MLESHKIYLYDRIKEISYVLGTQDFVLTGAVGGFSSFDSVYEDGDNVFYAATDGTDYEVGSGIYVTGVQNVIQRFPFRSSNNNEKVNFSEGVKEVFVTYPATHAVYTPSGLQNHSEPQEKGVAFWSSSNILNYDNNIIWDSGLKRLGIQKSLPVYAIDIGGIASESIIRASGFAVGSSGIIFPFANNGDSEYEGGVQLTHYEANELDIDSGIDQIIELSGNAKNNFLLKQQNAGFVFAGPVSGCTPPCSPDYPNFRPLFLKDIGELDGLYKEDRLDNPSLKGFRFDEHVGINTTPSIHQLSVITSTPNVAPISSQSFIGSPASSNLSWSAVGFVSIAFNTVNSGVSNSGASFGQQVLALRNFTTEDQGILSGIFGSYISYGNANEYPQEPYTKKAIGVYVLPQQGSGVIDESVDLLLADPDSEYKFGTIHQRYGIVQDGSDKKNILRGSLAVNTTASEFEGKISSFNNDFDPAAASGWYKTSYVGSGLYGGGIALLDTVNPSLENQYGYAIYTTDQGVNLNFDMGSRSGECDPVLRLFLGDQQSLNEASMVFFGDKLSIRNPKTPASATASGIRGDIAWDNNYIYVCVENNTWKRTYLSTW